VEREVLALAVGWHIAPTPLRECISATTDLCSIEAAALLSRLLDRMTLNAAGTPDERRDSRVEILESLTYVAALLDQDRAAISPSYSGRPPAPDAPAEHFIYYLTRDIRLHRGGWVQFVFEVPNAQWSDTLKRCTTLRLEQLWQEARGHLSLANISISIKPSEVVLNTTLRLPEGLKKQLAQLAPNRLLNLRHLGETPTHPIPSTDHGVDEPAYSESLFPIAGCAIEGSFTIKPYFKARHRLTVRRRRSPITYLEQVAMPGEAISIPADRLEAGCEYEWVLSRRANTGDLLDYRAGWFRRPRLGVSEIPQIFGDIAGEGKSEPDLALQRHLYVEQELIEATWRRVIKKSARNDEALWLLGRFLDALTYLQSEKPELHSQIDAYRNAADLCWTSCAGGAAS
jgi:hypothetical protein